MHKDLDIVRATITACCKNEYGVITPIHHHRISHLSKIFGLKGTFDEHLKVLKELEEIAELPKSYWVPVRSRSINLGNLWLILSSYPTEQLPKSINPQCVSGNARSADVALNDYPIQDLKSWLGITGPIISWLEAEMDLAKKNLKETSYALDDVEFYTPWIKNRTNNGSYQNWKKINSIGAEEKEHLMLGRYKGDYFWGIINSGSLYESSKIFDRNELIKTQFAIEKLFGSNGRKVKLEFSGDRFFITTKFKFPEYIQKIFLALADKNVNLTEEIYIFSERYFSFVQSKLSELNIIFT